MSDSWLDQQIWHQQSWHFRKETTMRCTYFPAEIPHKNSKHFVSVFSNTFFEVSCSVLASTCFNLKTSIVCGTSMLGPSDVQCGKSRSCHHSSLKAARLQSFESKFHWTVPKHLLWLWLDLGSKILCIINAHIYIYIMRIYVYIDYYHQIYCIYFKYCTVSIWKTAENCTMTSILRNETWP